MEVNIVGKTVEVEDDSGDDALKVVCLKVDNVTSGRPGLGVYRYYVNGGHVTAKEADVTFYQSERGRLFRHLRLIARAEYIKEFS